MKRQSIKSNYHCIERNRIGKSQRTGVSTFASSPSTDLSLQKSFHLSQPDKIELKKNSSPSENKKYTTAQTNTIQKMTMKLNNNNGLLTRWIRTPAGKQTNSIPKTHNQTPPFPPTFP